ncbi:hypothetical protein [Cellulomonas composti]|uniref:Uncharacterized protein n=1 Tax=Cellulomonas composti TaxID=266130 RepID=A0A511JBS1_9CELL|nr:hypothetical protein [Cellulomonas composti]GEL95437.1 hypothetical protein CCO02nite_20950 [Cellulomonas composti]
MATTDDVRLGEEPVVTRDASCLLALLEAIDDEGWDGVSARALLRFAREQIARPLAVDAGLRGAAAAQAEATAWQAMWMSMTKPALRRAQSPWGILWQTARRAVLAEVVAARYGTEPRRAWSLRRSTDGSDPMPIPISLDVLVDGGWEPTSVDGRAFEHALPDLTRVAVGALVAAGWAPELAARVVDAVIELPHPSNDPRSGALGWRRMARQFGLPPWQARRLCVALRGSSDWRGLFACVLADGPRAADSLPMRAALRATKVHRHRSPALAARLAELGGADRPQAEAA